MTEIINFSRIKRLAKRIISRFDDYSELESIQDTEKLRTWVRRKNVGMFNGNIIRSKIILELFRHTQRSVFVETGTSHAATAIGAWRLLGAPVFSCENSGPDYLVSRIVTLGIRDIEIRREDSRSFLKALVPYLARNGARPLFYLDAHEGRLDATSLPLDEELEVIMEVNSAVIVIDDFKVPDQNDYSSGTYGDREIDHSIFKTVRQKYGIDGCWVSRLSAVIFFDVILKTGMCVQLREEARSRLLNSFMEDAWR